MTGVERHRNKARCKGQVLRYRTCLVSGCNNIIKKDKWESIESVSGLNNTERQVGRLKNCEEFKL